MKPEVTEIMSSRPVGGSDSLADRVRHALEHASHLLAPQGPIKIFIHHNTLHGLQHRPFHEALATASELLGGRSYLPNSRFRELYHEARITREDLDDALAARSGGEEAKVRVGEISGVSIERLSMIHPMEPITAAELAWRLRELEEETDEASQALWRTCVGLLEIRTGVPSGETPEESVGDGPDGAPPDEGASLDPRVQETLLAFEESLKRGASTLATQVSSLGGRAVHAAIQEAMIRWCSGFLDAGVASWTMPERSQGFYATWRASFHEEISGKPGLPAYAVDAAVDALQSMGIPIEAWEAYIRSALLELPGWAGMIGWLAEHPDHPLQKAAPVDLAEMLAVRLQLERHHVTRVTRSLWGIDGRADALASHFRARPAELFLRRALHSGSLEEHLAGDVRRLAEQGGPASAWRELLPRVPGRDSSDACHRAWPLFQLCRHLGITTTALTRSQAFALLDVLAQFPAGMHGPIWQDAFERNYRQRVVDGVIANRGRWRARGRPVSQVVFCIDEREESFRRHMEEADPRVETMGTAGFFGIIHRYLGLGDDEPTNLCPVVATPAHELIEEPGTPATRRFHSDANRWLHALHDQYYSAPADATASWFLAPLAAPVVVANLLGRIVAPREWDELIHHVREIVLPAPGSVLPVDARPSTGSLKQGFSQEEQAACVEGTLRNIGLVHTFARLVVICAHGSDSFNNPHHSAHDCGACSGRPGGPNARAFASMANNSRVREMLSARGLVIPADTWFLGAEHNTCSEEVKLFDVDQAPESHRADLERMRQLLLEARQRSAQERCRRFASAPVDPTPAEALAHMEARARDISQTRPELGHATNASAFVGRRAITRGLFLDRRAFLISYDPTTDPDGIILERTLLAVGPVGAGISLEYYFSSVDNVRYGCDTKVPHNICGLIGVMEGTSSDLRTGLPLQMVEVHEPIRLQIFVEATTAVLGRIYGRQPMLQQLIGKEWVHLIAIDPDSGCISLFRGGAFVPCPPSPRPVPTVATSRDAYAGKRGFVPPALILGGTEVHDD